MFVRKILLISLVTSFFFTLNAQKKDLKTLQYERYAIGLSVSSFLNPVSGVQMSHDIGILPRLNMSIETAYLFYRNQHTDLSGFRIKAGPQFIVASSDVVGFVMGINYLYRQSREFSTVRSEIIFTGSSINELERLVTINGAELTVGALFHLIDRLKIEIGLGLGAGQFITKNISPENLMGINYYEGTDILINSQLDNVLPIVSFNINFSYALVKM